MSSGLICDAAFPVQKQRTDTYITFAVVMASETVPMCEINPYTALAKTNRECSCQCKTNVDWKHGDLDQSTKSVVLSTVL